MAERFKIYKLRTLKKTSFDKTIQVTQGDSRLLKIGKLIRKYSVDEIPQFLNVLLGDMSIVGQDLTWLNTIFNTLNYLKIS